MSLVWREQLSVGNDVIDSDHRHLIDLINRIEASLAARKRDEFQAMLGELSEYSRDHFAREEKIAHAAGYPQVGRLGLSHEKLLKRLDQVKREAAGMTQEWPPAKIAHFNEFVRSWLIEHVIREDLLLKPALQGFPPDFMQE